MITKSKLEALYIRDRKSMQEIALLMGCSLNKVKYWMEKNNIPIRPRAEAVYIKHNPLGDPFIIKKPSTPEEAKLFGIGIGLYWGEGTKADKVSVRLGNSDFKLVQKFMEFLVVFFGVKKKDFKFGLQVFNDTDPETALDFWAKNLKIMRQQFYKVIVTKSGAKGTYRKKSPYGVLTLYYHNRKLRDEVVGLLPM